MVQRQRNKMLQISHVVKMGKTILHIMHLIDINSLKCSNIIGVDKFKLLKTHKKFKSLKHILKFRTCLVFVSLSLLRIIIFANGLFAHKCIMKFKPMIHLTL